MQTAWPRASATAGITKGTAHGIASATTVSAGRRSHRKVVPLFCTSLPPGSVRRAAATVGTVFRCVASRNRERGPLGPGPPHIWFRFVVERRLRRVPLVVVPGGYPWPQLGLRLQLAQSATQQLPCVRFSVALPPGRGVPLPSWQTSGLLSRAQRETVGPLPSRKESISFLSPARAAGAPTFCDATESRQRTQPRGLRPLG